MGKKMQAKQEPSDARVDQVVDARELLEAWADETREVWGGPSTLELGIKKSYNDIIHRLNRLQEIYEASYDG